jgi:hypothetical protein
MDATQKKRYEHWAAIGYGGGQLISTAFQYYTHTGSYDKTRLPPVTPLQAVCLAALFLGHAYLVWKGNRWAKGLLLLFLVAGTFIALVEYGKGHNRVYGAPGITHTLFQWVLCAIVVVLLLLSFRKTSLTPETDRRH